MAGAIDRNGGEPTVDRARWAFNMALLEIGDVNMAAYANAIFQIVLCQVIPPPVSISQPHTAQHRKCCKTGFTISQAMMKLILTRFRHELFGQYVMQAAYQMPHLTYSPTTLLMRVDRSAVLADLYRKTGTVVKATWKPVLAAVIKDECEDVGKWQKWLKGFMAHNFTTGMTVPGVINSIYR